MSEMNDEFKNQIRRERILKMIKRYTNKVYIKISKEDGKYVYNSIPNNVYYKSKTVFSLKDVTEDDLIKFQNEIVKEDCINFINSVCKYSYDQMIKIDANMNVDEALLEAYRVFLLNEIHFYCPSFDTQELLDKSTSTEEIEEILDECIVKFIDDKKNKTKSWWNIF
jgi:hypothetical protein